jgi:hypothetical protein
MAFITQVLLPAFDNRGRRFPPASYRAFQQCMVERFEGWTQKQKAVGAWQSAAGILHLDKHLVYEIGHKTRNLGFWRAEKEQLKREFEQEEIWIVQFEVYRV